MEKYKYLNIIIASIFLINTIYLFRLFKECFKFNISTKYDIESNMHYFVNKTTGYSFINSSQCDYNCVNDCLLFNKKDKVSSQICIENCKCTYINYINNQNKIFPSIILSTITLYLCFILSKKNNIYSINEYSNSIKAMYISDKIDDKENLNSEEELVINKLIITENFSNIFNNDLNESLLNN